jgi:hypothetical protein
VQLPKTIFLDSAVFIEKKWWKIDGGDKVKFVSKEKNSSSQLWTRMEHIYITGGPYRTLTQSVLAHCWGLCHSLVPWTRAKPDSSSCKAAAWNALQIGQLAATSRSQQGTPDQRLILSH